MRASTEKATHVDIQNKLSEMLSSSDEEDGRDSFEDTPMDHHQPAASIGRAAYEVRLLDVSLVRSPK